MNLIHAGLRYWCAINLSALVGAHPPRWSCRSACALSGLVGLRVYSHHVLPRTGHDRSPPAEAFCRQRERGAFRCGMRTGMRVSARALVVARDSQHERQAESAGHGDKHRSAIACGKRREQRGQRRGHEGGQRHGGNHQQNQRNNRNNDFSSLGHDRTFMNYGMPRTSTRSTAVRSEPLTYDMPFLPALAGANSPPATTAILSQ